MAQQLQLYALPVGTLIKKRYRITAVLGAGGFGITYKVRDEHNGKAFAMKEYAPRALCVRSSDRIMILPKEPSKKDAYEHGRARFLEEAECLRKLDSIGGIVPVIDCFNQNDTSYFVMAYLRGVTLNGYLKEHDGRLGIADALNIVGNVAYALSMVHAQKGIFHRDISPDNIFLTDDHKVRVIDFGNARSLAETEDSERSIVLKPGFAPPEQYTKNGRQGSYTDVYALAGTLYYTVTGMMIPSAPDRMNGESYISLDEIFPELSKSVSDAVDHALVMDPAWRTRTMQQFMKELGLDSTLFEDKVKEVPYMELISGNHNVGRRWRFKPDTLITVGRGRSCDIEFNDNLYISKKHCEVYFDSELQLFYIEDYSTNGTFIGDHKIAKGELVKMKPGAEFSIGDKNTVLKVGVMHV